MFIGAHISAAGGVQNAPLNAHRHQAECYQFFSRSPQGGKAPILTDTILKQFDISNKKYGFANFYLHAPYYINLASVKNNIYYGSISVLREELERGTLLGARAMMFHLGSAKDLGGKEALDKVIAGLRAILKNYTGSCQPLIEISAGSGMIIGDTFEEIKQIINKVESRQSSVVSSLGVCFDTAHAFASGYDLRAETTIKKTFQQFDKTIGLDRLTVIHMNDSKTALGSHSDRHEHLGLGYIGLAGFAALVKYFKKNKPDIDFIMETPSDEGILKDIKLLKELRKNI